MNIGVTETPEGASLRIALQQRGAEAHRLGATGLTFYDDEHPIGAQLFGSNSETLADAARIVQDTGFDTVDLNLGCPAKRVVGCNGGSGLLRDLPKIGAIFQEIRKAVSIPFTVKFRLGWNDSQIVCVELAKMAQEEGLCAVALHARTLGFFHPATREVITLDAPLTAAWSELELEPRG